MFGWNCGSKYIFYVRFFSLERKSNKLSGLVSQPLYTRGMNQDSCNNTPPHPCSYSVSVLLFDLAWPRWHRSQSRVACAAFVIVTMSVFDWLLDGAAMSLFLLLSIFFLIVAQTRGKNLYWSLWKGVGSFGVRWKGSGQVFLHLWYMSGVWELLEEWNGRRVEREGGRFGPILCPELAPLLHWQLKERETVSISECISSLLQCVMLLFQYSDKIFLWETIETILSLNVLYACQCILNCNWRD